MAQRPDPYLIDDDNPEWTEADFAAARPAREVLHPELYAKLVAGMAAAPAPAPVSVTLPLDPRIVDRFKQSGPDWQDRIAETLKKAAGF